MAKKSIGENVAREPHFISRKAFSRRIKEKSVRRVTDEVGLR